ncbi:pathogenesis-related protein PR-1 type [Daucus carota subsp. sativus]|uniref:pathogenesis-related protein PR-1 type n=1 Tax=Daucus carota subsp. sativus TaxID=79200 RepID=UPI0030835AE6
MSPPVISATLVSAFCFLWIPSSLAQTSPQDFVDAHNAARAADGVGPIVWDETVAKYARNYARKIGPKCLMQHSGGPYGETLFRGGGEATAKEIVDYHASEKQYWDNRTRTCAPGQECGHYLQVVDPNSVQLGCARIKCRNDEWQCRNLDAFYGKNSWCGHVDENVMRKNGASPI